MSKNLKTIALGVALTGILAVAAWATPAQAGPNLDANRDGVVNSEDYNFIRGNVSAPADRLGVGVFAACDIDQDGRLTPADFMDWQSAFGVYDNPPLAANQQPKPGNAYPDMSWWTAIDYMGLV